MTGKPLHITSPPPVFINDDESGLQRDHAAWLEKVAPHEPASQCRHNDTGEDNADAHIQRQIMGREVVAIGEGRLDYGTWAQIFYGEFDGRRRKRIGSSSIRGDSRSEEHPREGAKTVRDNRLRSRPKRHGSRMGSQRDRRTASKTSTKGNPE